MPRNELYPDPLFVEPFIDVDEWRDEPERHRYVHGGFTGTDLRFSMYFPPAERYEGRFIQPLMHIAGNENVAVTGELAGLGHVAIQFAFDSGGYLVESNMGSTMMMGPADITGFRASAATAQYSRVLAEEMYADTHGVHRPYGYVTGGSGGAYKTMACYENAPGVWDGAVPFIHGSHVSMPNVFTVQAHAFRVLEDAFDRIVDAVEPGGGDMYAGLDEEQRAGPRRDHPHGVPAARVVRPRTRRALVHRRVRGDLRHAGDGRPRVLRGLLDRARLPRRRSATVARSRPVSSARPRSARSCRPPKCGRWVCRCRSPPGPATRRRPRSDSPTCPRDGCKARSSRRRRAARSASA